MAGIRMTGLSSGLDTESLVAELSKAYQTKVDDAKKQQTKAEWKKEAWASLNTKIMNFYKNALSTFKSSGTYSAKAVNGDLSGVKITAGAKAATGSHKVQVTSTASAQMWTGHKINNDTYAATSYTGATGTDKNISDLYDSNGYSLLNRLNGSNFTVASGNKTANVSINIDENSTVNDMLSSIESQLTSNGITDFEVGFENGAFKFTNKSVDNSVAITAADSTFAKALGIAGGVTVEKASDTETVSSATGSVFAYSRAETGQSSVGSSTRLVDLGIAAGTVIKVNETEITIDRNTTLSSLATSMEKAGINANYDTNQGRFYLSSKDTGTDNKFTIETDTAGVLAKLGLDYSTEVVNAIKEANPDNYSSILGCDIAATDASIVYNRVTYTQSSNSFSINGLTIDVNKEGEEQEFSVDTDVDGIYDKVKNFIKEYNSLISEMNTLYNADSSRGYEPLTSDEKDAMTDEEAEKWEKKIKDSLLRRDSTISSLLSSMRTTLNKSVEVTNSDGTTSRYALSSFGIVSGNYTEKGQLHIEGDADDSDYSSYDDKLKAAISENPEALIKTLTTLGSEMYENLMKSMKRIDGVRSSQTFYNDVTLDNEIRGYKENVTEMQEKMQEEEDRYYDQFAAMETAMARLQSQQTYISQLFGG